MDGAVAQIDESGQKVKLNFDGVGAVEFVLHAGGDEAKQHDMEGLLEWLAKKLEEERAEVQVQLQKKHIELIEQFLVFKSQSESLAETHVQASPPGAAVRPQAGSTPIRGMAPDDTLLVYDLDKSIVEDQGCNQERDTETQESPACVASDPPQPEDLPKQVARLSRSLDEFKQPLSEQHFSSAHSIFRVADDWSSTQQGQRFEAFMTLVILLNSLVMALDAQYRGLELGYMLSIREYSLPGDEAWPGGEITFEILEKMFTLIFTCEFGFRFYIYRLRYFRDKWCYIDGIVVLIAWTIFFKSKLPNLTFVRLARFTKMLRLIHIMRRSEIFESLKLLVAAIRASVNTLFWSLTVIMLIQAIAGLGMVQVLEPWLMDESHDVILRRRVFAYFGTFWRSIITMFEITFANWAPSCRLLIDHVNEWYGLFYLMYRCVIGFCVLMVVQAVFIQQTMKTTKLDDKHLAMMKQRQKADLSKRLEELFKILDTDSDGYITWGEMTPWLGSGELELMLNVFEIETADFETLFALLDDGDGRISIDEFVTGVQHVHGTARSIDLMLVKRMIREGNTKIMKLISDAPRKELGSYMI